jgi:hypothetical protein
MDKAARHFLDWTQDKLADPESRGDAYTGLAK